MIDLAQLKEGLTPESIIDIVYLLGADRCVEKEEYILFPTICHNFDSSDASLKLYYYKDSKTFHCYTDCGETFDIYGLFSRVYDLHNKEYNFYKDVIAVIINKAKIDDKLYTFDEFKYESVASKYKRKNKNIQLPEFPKGVLDVFVKEYPSQWRAEGITNEIMKKYDIRFSISQNKIIIPHYDIDGRLVGIRGRALNQDEIDAGCKYMPVKIENKWYSHSLSLNLYGIDLNKNDIKKSRKVILFEGEKSTLLYDSYFNIHNSLAVCGFSFNKLQLDLLIKNFDLDEIIIAFDKEYKNYNDPAGQEYFSKLNKLCKKYSNYCNFSFIFDRENLTKEKDSPIDCGKETFIKLFNNRIKI